VSKGERFPQEELGQFAELTLCSCSSQPFVHRSPLSNLHQASKSAVRSAQISRIQQTNYFEPQTPSRQANSPFFSTSPGSNSVFSNQSYADHVPMSPQIDQSHYPTAAPDSPPTDDGLSWTEARALQLQALQHQNVNSRPKRFSRSDSLDDEYEQEEGKLEILNRRSYLKDGKEKGDRESGAWSSSDTDSEFHSVMVSSFNVDLLLLRFRELTFLTFSILFFPVSNPYISFH